MKRSAVLFVVLWALLGAAQAPAAEPFEFDPTLSLTGDCSTSAFDPVPDPSCPYPPPPAGPTLSNCNKTGECSSRFKEPRAIAVDSFGNEFVASYADGEDAASNIDVFDDEGKFLTEVAAPNGKSITVDSKGNLYVFEDSGKVMRYPPSEYKPEEGKVKYANPAVTVSTGELFGALAIDISNDQLFVVRGGTIFRHASAEAGNGVVESFTPADIGSWTEGIAVDGQRRRIYVSFCKGEITECGVKVVGADAPHTLLKDVLGPSETEKFAATQGRLGIAADEATGDFFVGDFVTAKKVYQFSEDYELLSQIENKEFQANASTQIAISNGKRSLAAEACKYPKPEIKEVPAGDACNRHYLFAPAFKSNGRALAFAPPGQTAPVIEEVSSAGIGETEAELRARIDPRGLETEYHFELTTQEAFEAEGWEGAEVLGEGTISAESLATEVTTFATGLSAGVTYRFRALAANDLGPAPEEDNEATFTTYDDVVPPIGGCANEALRIGPSANLPDCRAYELVTPADTNGRPPRGVGFVGNLFSTVETNPAGDAVAFKIEGGSLPGSSGVGSFEGDPYVARRSSSGWTTSLEGPSGDEAAVANLGSTSPDQGYSFFTARIEGPLVIEKVPTEYLRYPDGHPELIGRGILGADPRARGLLITENATHVLFETIKSSSIEPIQLEPNAPPTGTTAVYDRTIELDTGAEVTNVVSLLPGDVTPAAGQNATYLGASKDGEGIAFSIGGTLYLRVDNETTYEIGTGVEFAGVSEGGERIFYVEGGDLEAFDTSSEEVIEFTTSGNVTPVNVSIEGTRAYFVSPTVLGGTNPQGDSAQAGEQNLYLSEDGAIAFVATVTDRDVEGAETSDFIQFDGLGLWTQVGDQIAKDPSRTNPDGSVLLFQSRANITGYEESEFPQIYRYDSAAGRLHCISCIPTGTAATGGASLESYTFDSATPLPFSPNGFVPNLTPSGNRVFFESDEALVSTDTDEVKDVYEWEEQGVGSCDRPGGCVYLISTGQSGRDNFLYAHSQSGDDVFFTTGDTLTGSDTGGATSIYDAKVGGGFATPTPPDPCVADGCRPEVTPAPVTPSSESSGQGSSGNLGGQKPHCPKGKRKVKQNGKVRCVKKKKQKAKGGKAKQRAGANRGAGR